MKTIEQRIDEFLVQKPIEVHIAINGVWSASLQNGGSLFSYEKLDYHTGCREFLEGVKKAGVAIINHSDIAI